MSYDYLIVGSGLFGSTFGNIAHSNGKKCLIIDKKNHIAGNIYSEKRSGIDVHVYGPHIFNTKNEEVWNYVNRFCQMNEYWHLAKANYKGMIYSLPFNMNTFQELWGCKNPDEAKKIIDQKRIKIDNPQNLEEQALSMVGQEIYEKLIYGYTKKQWMCEPCELPASIIKRIPFKFEFDNRYHNAIYSGIPQNGYTDMIQNMLEGIQVELGVDFFEDKQKWLKVAKKIIYTGRIDEYYDFKFGELNYRTLKFEHQTLDCENYQGVSQMNFTDFNTPYTRIVEHKHFNPKPNNKTIITYEFPVEWHKDAIPYYPINNYENNEIYNKYKIESEKDKNLLINGRLGKNLYVDMDQIVAMAMNVAKSEQLIF
jgi:UDP-galactopyranose mutase